MRLAIAALLCWLAGGTSVLGADCTASGRYDGQSKMPGETFDVSLNLYCTNGKFAAQLFTSQGTFEVKEVGVTPERLVIRFDSGASLGTIEMLRQGNALSGSVAIAGETGVIILDRKGDAEPPSLSEPRLDLTPAQWHEDLAAFARELPKRHANAFYTLSRAAFDAEVAALDARVATANGDEMFVGLQTIAKSIGDGHTGVIAPKDRRVMPLKVAKFGSDFRIVATGLGLERAFGARVVKIGGMPMAEVWRRALTLTSADELDELRTSEALIYLSRGYALHGLGITLERTHVVYTLEDEAGRAFDLDVGGLLPGQDAHLRAPGEDTALRLMQTDATFACANPANTNAVYCAWRGYENLDRFAKQMFALLQTSNAQKLVLDMRDNGGGDNTVGYGEIIKPLKARADLNRKGRLYVLVGAETFSAAMNNAAQFQDETNAILVGETIGERPNSYQEPRQFRLPNSHLVVRASTLYYTFRKKGENAVRPDKEIIPTWDDVKAGRDPVLEWTLAQPIN
jgi:Peptidase family S41